MEKNGQEPTTDWLRRINGTGHTLRRSDERCQTKGYNWQLTPQSYRGRTKNFQKRDTLKEMVTAGFRYSWSKMEAAAQDRAGWRQVVCGLLHWERQGISQVNNAHQALHWMLHLLASCVVYKSQLGHMRIMPRLHLIHVAQLQVVSTCIRIKVYRPGYL